MTTSTTRFIRHPSTLGMVLIAMRDDALAGIWFEGQRHAPDTRGWQEAAHPLLKKTARQLDAYFAGDTAAFDVPLHAQVGTPFQQAVWAALREIPRGATSSYGALARRVGKPEAARAVGAAVGRNPWSVVVPCHRVLGTDGSLTGYAGGLERKRALLQLEGAWM